METTEDTAPPAFTMHRLLHPNRSDRSAAVVGFVVTAVFTALAVALG
jgi:hypothetical protein